LERRPERVHQGRGVLFSPLPPVHKRILPGQPN
jgi:hypothetical protein